jgi:short-subunit dehydrogenase
VLAAEVDVSEAPDVEELARKSLAAYETVHMLFNNAGVAPAGPIWENTLAECEWGIGVNLWGVIHGLRTFIPIMLRQETECHIVNTASTAGFGSSHPSAIYQLTKHAVVSLSESVYHHLKERNAKIQVSVLCPGWVNTRILESERNAPAGVREPSATDSEMKAMRQMIANAQAPAAVAEKVFRAIQDERFYIFTDSDFKAAIRTRCEGIIEARNPVPDELPG